MKGRFAVNVVDTENKMELIAGERFDEERALYGSRDIHVKDCAFDGPADGESAFKECRDVKVENCYFNLRYPFWHDQGLVISGSELTELCRAALWYSADVEAADTKLHGIKALRECSRIRLRDCTIISPEFGWFVHQVEMERCSVQGEYFMLRSDHLTLREVHLKGKYSFQYVENALLENCVLDTKDALWHAKNVVVRNCEVKGEYLAWYCENVTFDHCRISGTQPLCYCKGLKLIDCDLTEADLCFEKSEVEATLRTHVDSIKNPLSGTIALPSVGEVIRDDPSSHAQLLLNA